MLARRSALRPGKPLRRGKGLARSPMKTLATPKRSQVKHTAPRDTGPDRKTRLLVLERDGWACVCCGRSVIGQRYSLQHRKRRSQDGTNSATNLLTVLGDGTTGCHARIDSRIDPHDEARGYTVRSGQDPALVPVMLHGNDGGVTVWLGASGEYLFEPPEAGEAA